jgi:hypothetical protein
MSALPLFSGDWAPYELQYIPSVLVGFLFGFVLERSGFGDSRVLAAQFYLHNMRVFKVMFSAIVTAAAGVALTSATGLLDMSAMEIPETFLWPHLVGGLLLGAGFIVSGYCPGTSVVAAASGHWDGLVVVAGVVVGSVLFGELYPVIGDFHVSGAMGVLTLDQLTGIPLPVLVLLVGIAAAGMFFGAEAVERIFSRRTKKEKERSWTRGGLAPLTAVLVAALVATVAGLASRDRGAAPGKPWNEAPGTLTAFELATRLVEEPRGLTLVDLRGKAECEAGPVRIPTSACFDDVKESLSTLPEVRGLVVFGEGPLDASQLPPDLASFPGRVLVLSGGIQEWARLIVAPEADSGLTAALDPAQRQLLPALHAYFTGSAVQAAAPAAAPKAQRKAGKKKGGGCS